MAAGFDGTTCVWAKENRLDTVFSSDRKVIKKKNGTSAQRIIELETLKWVLSALGLWQVLGQY